MHGYDSSAFNGNKQSIKMCRTNAYITFGGNHTNRSSRSRKGASINDGFFYTPLVRKLKLPPLLRLLISPNDIAKKHQLLLVLVGLFSLATNGSLVLMPNGSLSLVTVSREDRRVPMTTDDFRQHH